MSKASRLKQREQLKSEAFRIFQLLFFLLGRLSSERLDETILLINMNTIHWLGPCPSWRILLMIECASNDFSFSF